jgi:histidinol-phosphatase
MAVSYSNMPSKELTAALEAVRAAEEVIRSLFGRNPAVRTKPDQSPVTEADVRAEELIRATLSRHFPAYGFYGEETGQHAMQAESIWLVDPIDGTKSFVRESPFFSTQIALMRGGRLVLGVSNAPLFGELAWAEEGAGAWLNERAVRVSAVSDLAAAAMSSGNLKGLTSPPRWERYGELVARVNYSRGYGDFAHYHMLARGALDVVIESGVNILDIAALTVIVREAGGTFTDLEGAAVGLDTTSVLATNGRLHAAVLEALRR